jgi:DNA polymerase II small subunit
MDKKEIVKRFFGKENLLTPKALSFMESQDTETIEGDFTDIVLTEKTFVAGERIIKNLSEKLNEIKTEDFIRFFSSKYEKMKNIITERLQKNFVSLNKTDSSRNEVYSIGIVKEIKEKNNKQIIELEDPTATKPIIYDSTIEGVDLDDVIAVRAIAAGDVLYGKEVLFPDIPLRQPAKGSGKACFISDLHLEESATSDLERFFNWFYQQNIPYLFVAGDISTKKERTEEFEKLVERYCFNKKIFIIPGNVDDPEYPQLAIDFKNRNIISLSNPAMVEINGIKVLLIHQFDLSMLKKRYLGKSNVILKEDYLVLDHVPDIVHCGHTHQPLVMNYKSVTIVNSGSLLAEFKPVVVDFSTREVEQVSL